MGKRFRIPFNPDADLFRWGPIPGRILSISHWPEIFSSRQGRFHAYLWPPTLILMYRRQILGVLDRLALEADGARVFGDFVVGRRYRRGRKEYRKQTASLQHYVRVVESLPLQTMSDTGLMRHWKQLNAKARQWWVPAILPELGGYGGQAILSRRLSAAGLTGRRYLDAFSVLAATGRPSFYQKEELALARLLRFPSGSAAERNALRRHQRRYAWIGNSYFRTHDEPLDAFRRRLDDLRGRGVTFRALAGRVQRHARDLERKKTRLLRTLHNQGLHQISNGVARCVWWQDQRKAFIFQYVAAVDRMAREIERRAGVPTGTFDSAYFWEVTLYPSARLLRLLKGRQRGFVSRFTGKPDADYSPRHARLIIRRLWNPTQAAATELSGISTYAIKNPVRARVFIIRNHNDLARFPKGAVLVAAMTAPEYVVAMRRASAIVTDTGGITSHAAIVSRELKIPCIVGTKHATALLKTGDRVEVDATKGIVRKLRT